MQQEKGRARALGRGTAHERLALRAQALRGFGGRVAEALENIRSAIGILNAHPLIGRRIDEHIRLEKSRYRGNRLRM